MNKTIRYSLMALATILSLGCQRRGGEQPKEVRAVHILSTLSYEKVSKGVVLQDTELTNVRFLQIDSGTGTPTSFTSALPFLGNRAADGSITWQGTTYPIYTQTNLNAYLVAYHPQTNEVLGSKIDWIINGKNDLLLSPPWDAGNYTTPKTGTGSGETPLTFNHVLAQLNVVFQAENGTELAQVQRQYGKITGVQLMETLPTATYTYATNAVTFGGVRTNFPLLQSDCQTDFEPIAIPASDNATVNAAGLFAPAIGAFTVVVSTEQFRALPVVVTLTGAGGNKDFEAGLKHTITITFNPQKSELSVSDCSIVEWVEEYSAGSDVEI